MSDPRSFVRALALTLAAAGVATVQGATPDTLPAQLRHCASLPVAGDRLACYDALAASAALNPMAPPTAAARSGATPGSVAAPAGVAAPARLDAPASPAAPAGPASPGASPAPSDTEFGVHNGPLEAKRITPQREKRLLAVVSTISNRAHGELVVTLDNGQVWAQLEPSTYPLKPGDHVEIDVGALGSYVLWTPSIRRATQE